MPQNPETGIFMVWAVISERGNSPLVFMSQEVRINKEVYIDDILEGALKQWYNITYDNDHLKFQQDRPMSHTAHPTQQ